MRQGASCNTPNYYTIFYHQTFLKNLKRVLPENRDICIIVDAGFRTDFFIQVQTESWDYVGRILSTMHYTPQEENDGSKEPIFVWNKWVTFILFLYPINIPPMRKHI